MANFNETITKEDAIRTYNRHMTDFNQGYFKSMKKFADTMLPLTGGLDSPFSKEGWDKILKSDSLWEKALSLSSEQFRGNVELQNRFKRLMNNTREVANTTDRTMQGIEGWGGGTAVYSSSQGTFAMGATPYIIGGWLAACRSEEIFQHIDDQNRMRLEFEYNVDYLQIGNVKHFFPQAYRSGEIEGFNKLPKVDWVTPNTTVSGGTTTYTAPADWCGEDMFILLTGGTGSKVSSATGNMIEACGKSKHKYGIEPNCRLTAVKYKTTDGEEEKEVVHKLNLHYMASGDRPNKRLFETQFVIKNLVVGEDTYPSTLVKVKMDINLDTSDFTIAVIAENEKIAAAIKGLKFDGKLSNEANEMTDLPTVGTDKYQFIRECEYRNYAKVSLNEYMADNFRIGSNNNISYAAYATDKVLQNTIGNRELEAESYLINDILDDDVDLENFELTNKLGGFIDNGLSFTIGRFAPGLKLQDYKEGLKTYLTDTLDTSETDLHLPASVKREWIMMGYNTVVTKFPELKFENAVVNLREQPVGTQVNENYGYAVDSKCGFIDSLGRSVRIIGNTDQRWRDRGANLFGALRTYSMEYPFLVYYPHAIRMFTAIDADMPNRTAIVVGGREYRGSFAAAAFQLKLNGVLNDDGSVVNNFDAQIKDAHEGYVFEGVTPTVNP